MLTPDTNVPYSTVVVSIGAPLRVQERLAARSLGPLLWIDPLKSPASIDISGIASRADWAPAPTGMDALTALQFSLPDLFAFAPALPLLRELYPGIRVVSETLVPTREPAELVAALVSLEGRLVVILDAPGTELATLEALADDAVLDRLSTLEVRCSAEAVFVGGTTRTEIEAWADAHALLLSSCDDSDPDWPVLTFRNNDIARRLFTAQVLQAESERDAAKKRVAALELELLTVTKLQATVSFDLENLREQYAQVCTIRDQQSELLAELVTSLQDVAAKLRTADLDVPFFTDLVRDLSADALSPTSGADAATASTKPEIVSTIFRPKRARKTTQGAKKKIDSFGIKGDSDG